MSLASVSQWNMSYLDPFGDTKIQPTLNPGFSIYSAWISAGGMEDLFTTLKSEKVKRWALAEGANIGNSKSMETYLAELYNHGAVLTTLFGWGLGQDPNMEFRYATENVQAIEAYKKFLRGEDLKK
ncbi:MAG: hypothetical protein AB7G93_03170 [Bdellovibrionales bacterium]